MRSHIVVCLALVCMLIACEPKPAATAPPTVPPSEPITLVVSATPTFRPVQKTHQPSIMANVMHWETNGGGQITFSVTRNGQAYDVLVTSHLFKARKDRFTITAEAGPVYEALSRVMQNQGSIGSYAPDGPPRGSWTTLEFSDGARSSIYQDVITYSDLRIIFDYVAAEVEQE